MQVVSVVASLDEASSEHWYTYKFSLSGLIQGPLLR